MSDLVLEVKNLIIQTLNLEGIESTDIDAAVPLFGDGLGLDSIDALELGLAVKKYFNIEMTAKPEELQEYFYSVKTLATYIEKQKK